MSCRVWYHVTMFVPCLLCGSEEWGWGLVALDMWAVAVRVAAGGGQGVCGVFGSHPG